ncbi:DinB family protein [Heyndrickxia sp. NPDC080065]|uniref:DinB family protein n=1 Tax=Heyndrickxia sp. NPDC080065 TaxID=3390568 RepID=UPI003D046F8A
MNTLVNQLTKWIDYLEEIQGVPHEEFFQPIAEGKWSKAAIITHIMFWDRFFFEERLPSMLDGGVLSGIDANQVEEMNKEAEAYAHSGVTLSEIIDAAILQRKQIVEQLQEQDLSKSFTIKDNQYTLESYVKGEVEHDIHHLKQLKKG